MLISGQVEYRRNTGGRFYQIWVGIGDGREVTLGIVTSKAAAQAIVDGLGHIRAYWSTELRQWLDAFAPQSNLEDKP